MGSKYDSTGYRSKAGLVILKENCVDRDDKDTYGVLSGSSSLG